MSLTESEMDQVSQVSPKNIEVIKDMIKERIERQKKNWTSEISGSLTEDVKILLCGLGGVGKSSLGNVLAKNPNERFDTGNKATAETNKVKVIPGSYEGVTVHVCDTPGYLLREVITETETGDVEVDPTKAVTLGLSDLNEDFNVIIFVLNASDPRNRQAEVKLMQKLLLATQKMLNHCMMVVTHSASQYDDMSVHDFIQDGNHAPSFKNFIREIGERVVLVEIGAIDPVTPAKIKTFTAVYEGERDAARDSILKLAGKIRHETPDVITKAEIEAEIKACFNSQATVTTPQGKKTMEDLQLNDDVLVTYSQGQVQYEKVIMFSHANPSHTSYFCTISTEDGKVLQLSPGHLLHVGKIGKLTAAQDVKLGDIVFTCDDESSAKLNPAQVTAISGEWLTGIYCPHTPSGSIIVDGVAASCYTNLLSPTLAHAFMLPVRVAHRLLPDDWFRWMIPYNKEQGMPSLALRVSKMMKWA